MTTNEETHPESAPWITTAAGDTLRGGTGHAVGTYLFAHAVGSWPDDDVAHLLSPSAARALARQLDPLAYAVVDAAAAHHPSSNEALYQAVTAYQGALRDDVE